MVIWGGVEESESVGKDTRTGNVEAGSEGN